MNYRLPVKLHKWGIGMSKQNVDLPQVDILLHPSARGSPRPKCRVYAGGLRLTRKARAKTGETRTGAASENERRAHECAGLVWFAVKGVVKVLFL
jgi:hypothetical protein